MNYMKIGINYIELLLMSDNYLNDSGFLLVIFEIFVDLLLIIGIIYRRKYEPLNNLKIICELV